MMEDELRELWSRRKALVAKFIDRAEEYQECEQCRAISPKQAGICGFCGSYRFLEDPERVRATARIMGTRPFPLAAAVIPRTGLSSGRFCRMMGGFSKRIDLWTEANRMKSE